MVRLLRWIGFLMTVFRNALIGAASATSGGGGGGGANEYGITAFSGGTIVGSSSAPKRGYEFTVGASDITLIALRGRAADTINGSLFEVFKVSDGSRVASVSIDLIADEWVEEAVTSVTLSASTNYVVSGVWEINKYREYNLGGSASITFSSDISYVAGRFGVATANVMPATDLANYAWGLPDIVYTT